MEVKGSAINPLYENQKTVSCVIGYFSLETDLTTVRILDPVHPTDPTAGE